MKLFKSLNFAGLALSLLYLGSLGCGNGANPVILTITPTGPTLVLKGDTLQFTASRTDVTWTVEGGAGNGSIDADGTYTPPASLPVDSPQVTVQAQSSDGQTADGSVDLHTAADIAFGATEPVNDTPLPGGLAIIAQLSAGDRLSVRLGSVQIDTIWTQENAAVPGLGNVFYSQNLDFGGFSPEENIGNDAVNNQIPTSIETDGNENPGILFNFQPPAGAERVHFIGSSDQGVNFNAPVPISPSNPLNDQRFGVLRVDAQNNLHAVFQEVEDLLMDVFMVNYVQSDDGGATWSSPVPVFSTNTDSIVLPHLVSDPSGNNIYVCWTEGSGGVAFARSTNGGASFGARVPVDTNPDSGFCRAALGPLGEIYLSYSLETGADASDVLLVKSTDGGVTFGSPTTVNTDPVNATSTVAFLSVDDLGRIDLIWSADLDNSGMLDNLMYARSVNGGTSFSDDISIFDGPGQTIISQALRHDAAGRTYVSLVEGDATDANIFFLLGE